MKKALIVLLCVTMLLLTACSAQVKTQATTPAVKETAAAVSVLSTDSPKLSPTTDLTVKQTIAPKPTVLQTPKPTVIKTPKPPVIHTTKPTFVLPTILHTAKPKDLSAILGMWYNIGDHKQSVDFHSNGTAAFLGIQGDITGYEFDPDTLTGTMMIDEGSGISYPFPFSIESGYLHLIGEKFKRAPSWFHAIAGGWICTTDPGKYIVFYADGTAYLHWLSADCTGYEFNEHTMTGRVFIDDGGGPYPYDISITGGVLNMLGETYTRH